MAISPLGYMALRCSIVEIMTCFMLVSRYLNYRNSSWHSHHSVHFSRQLCLYKLAIHIWKVCLICGSFLILKLPHEIYFLSVVIGNLNINLIFHVNLFISTNLCQMFLYLQFFWWQIKWWSASISWCCHLPYPSIYFSTKSIFSFCWPNWLIAPSYK